MIVDPKSVSNRIGLIRKQNGLSQERLAQKLKISQPAISTYLHDRIPPADTLLKLARLGQTTVEWILTGQKSYAFEEKSKNVREQQTVYDADWLLAKKIAALPDNVKEALILLTDQLTRQLSTIDDGE